MTTSRTSSIAFVGAGPTTLYTLAALLRQARAGVGITVFEEQATAGLGAPYRPGWNDPAMLANIASIEIPPLTETLLDWLSRKSPDALAALGVAPGALDERAFYPRVVLGEYFREQLDTLVARARAVGIEVEIRTRCKVIDARNLKDGLQLTVSPRRGFVQEMLFDHVVLATGHQWPSEQEVRPGYFLSPWPAAALARIAPVEVGIRGSSLTAIDAAVALSATHGAFVRTPQGLTYEPQPGTEGFRLTMMSRKGLLPEADFFFPLPPAPLEVCTTEAVDRLIDEEREDLLEAVFDLFRRELQLADPAYFETMNLAEATLEDFGERYFADRAASDPFVWARANLEEARRNHASQITIAWRDAILRMHEVVAGIVPYLDATAFQRFSRHLKPIFVDDYGAVPHESIERMLALHDAGRLEILALGDDYRIDTRPAEGGAVIQQGQESRHFPVFIEATGQRPLSAIQFPFLSLIEQGIVHDEATPDGSSRGIVMDDQFRPISDLVPQNRLFCLSLPFIMGRHPFVQGLTSSHDMGEIVGAELARAKARALKRAKGWDAPHRDDMYEAEQAFALDEVTTGQRLYIHLTPVPEAGDPPFTCDYWPIRNPSRTRARATAE